jgi:hypothetical protein
VRVPGQLTFVVKIDRLQCFAHGSVPASILGFTLLHDRFVRVQTKSGFVAYGRVREYVNSTTGTRVFLQYQPRRRGLPPFKITLISNDRNILSRLEIEGVLKSFANYRLLLLETTFDFHPHSGIDLTFVRRHALFGKSRRKRSRLYPHSELYGCRKAEKLARCYWKQEANAFRVEIELHSAWLRRYGILTLKDLRKLPCALFPNHIRLVDVDWAALRSYLSARRLNSSVIIEQAKARGESIHAVLGFLRNPIGVPNMHRFLITVPPSHEIFQSLKNWSRKF